MGIAVTICPRDEWKCTYTPVRTGKYLGLHNEPTPRGDLQDHRGPGFLNNMTLRKTHTHTHTFRIEERQPEVINVLEAVLTPPIRSASLDSPSSEEYPCFPTSDSSTCGGVKGK